MRNYFVDGGLAMKLKKRLVLMLALTMFALFAANYAAYADSQDKLSPYQQIATVSVPSGFVFPGGGFDIVWADSSTNRVYIADRGNATANVPPGVDVFSTKHPKFLFEIPLPTSGGTNGVLVFHKSGDDDNQGDDNGLGTLVVGGTDSNTYFVNLSRPFAAPIAVSTGGKARADELAYDPKHQIILIANPDEAAAKPTPGVPFITFISTATVTPSILGKIIYDGKPGDGPAATGIEQPVWDGLTGKFYLTIPGTSTRPKGEIDEIDPTTRMITRSFATTCSPAGLALIPGQRLITSCGDVVNISDFTLVTTVTGIGPADEIWYNPGDERVYFGGIFGSPVVNGVANASAPFYSVIATLPWTGHFTPAPAQFSHSIAADSVYNHSFVPVSNLGVLVFTDDSDFGNGQNGQ
jgi:hypothetical protein